MPRKAYYDNNKELCKAIANKSYHKNKEKIAIKAAANREAKRDYNKEYWDKLDHPRKMLKAVRNSARSRGRECNITVDDIVIPDFCPILGIPLFPGNVHRRPNSPSVDRIDNDKGYIKGNVQVISCKANTMKSDASVEELERFAEWVRTLRPSLPTSSVC